MRGVRLMVDEERAANEVLQQLHAIQGSLRIIRTLLLKEQLYESLPDNERQTLASSAGLQQALEHILTFKIESE